MVGPRRKGGAAQLTVDELVEPEGGRRPPHDHAAGRRCVCQALRRNLDYHVDEVRHPGRKTRATRATRRGERESSSNNQRFNDDRQGEEGEHEGQGGPDRPLARRRRLLSRRARTKAKEAPTYPLRTLHRSRRGSCGCTLLKVASPRKLLDHQHHQQSLLPRKIPGKNRKKIQG